MSEQRRVQRLEIDSTKTRKDFIASCDKCNGSPKEEPLDLIGFTGSKCGDCLQVISWGHQDETAVESTESTID